MNSFVQQFSFGSGDDDDRPEPARPRWLPPEEELGVAVPIGLVLARSEHGVVALSHALAHSTGIRFTFLAQARGIGRRAAQQIFHEQHGVDAGDLPDGFVRLGVELPGGVRVSNLGRRHPWGASPDEEPDGPLFFQVGGGGGTGSSDGASLDQDYWLWPLPEPGTLRLSCEWPLVEIPLSTREVDGAGLVAAAAGAVPLWS